MEKTIRIFSLIYFISIGMISCDSTSEADPDANLLQNVGFEGTLPDGSSFGNTDIRSSNGVGMSGVNFKYSGSHFLSIRSNENGWTLGVELPSKNIPDNPPIGESVPSQTVFDFFNVHYPYEEILEVFITEKEKAEKNANYSSFDQFRVQLSNDKKYYSYLSNFFPIPQPGVIRILEVEEGIQKNLAGLDVRTIEVVMEFDILLNTSETTVSVKQGKLKGIARFKFREDYYQGEF